MRIAVVGGTGVAGRHTVAALRRAGHDTVVVTRARGVDVVSGKGLDDALVGVDVVVDATAVQGPDAGKRLQEEIVSSGSIPRTIQRATQFHEFARTVVDWTRQGNVAHVPPLLIQPVAAADVGEVLAEVATGDPQGRATDLAGPEPQDLVDMARRILAARGESIRLIPSWRTGVFRLDAAGEALLPGPDARLAPTTFDAWLAGQGAQARSAA